MNTTYVDFKTHPELYTGFRRSVMYCSEIPNEVSLKAQQFHCFWRVPGEFGVKQELSIISYLKTQHYNDTLTLWSNVDLTTNSFLKKHLDYITFCKYNPIELAKNTPLEGRKDILLASDNKCYLDSDLFRLLVLYKFGGVYFDMDVILLRDFTPLLHNEFAYQWGVTQDVTNTIMFLNKGSSTAEFLLNKVSETCKTGNSTCWGKDIVTAAYHKGLIKCLPCAWFDTEWAISDADQARDAEMYKFVRWPFKRSAFSSLLFDGVFAWHYHNQYNEPIEEGSKFWYFQKRFNQI